MYVTNFFGILSTGNCMEASWLLVLQKPVDSVVGLQETTAIVIHLDATLVTE